MEMTETKFLCFLNTVTMCGGLFQTFIYYYYQRLFNQANPTSLLQGRSVLKTYNLKNFYY